MMVEEGLALASRHLDRYYEAELHRLHGLLLALEPAELRRRRGRAATGAHRREVTYGDRARSPRRGDPRDGFLTDQGRSEEARSLLRDELHGDVSKAEGPERHAAEAALAALG